MQQTTSHFKGVDTVILWVRNLDRSRKWYLEKLGLEAKHVDKSEGLAILETGGETSITLQELKPGGRKPASDTQTSLQVLLVDGVESLHKRLKAFPDSLKEPGVEVGPIRGGPNGTRWFELWDLDQNKLHACSYQRPSPAPGNAGPG